MLLLFGLNPTFPSLFDDGHLLGSILECSVLLIDEQPAGRYGVMDPACTVWLTILQVDGGGGWLSWRFDSRAGSGLRGNRAWAGIVITRVWGVREDGRPVGPQNRI